MTEPNSNPEVYFVGSDGDMPEAMYFTLEAAKASEARYIDSFDAKGVKVRAYKRDGHQYITEGF